MKLKRTLAILEDAAIELFRDAAHESGFDLRANFRQIVQCVQIQFRRARVVNRAGVGDEQFFDDEAGRRNS